MASLTASGVGSGLDVTSLVSQLMSAERAPAESRLGTRESAIKSKLSAFGSLKSAVADFQTVLGKLSASDAFDKRTVTLSQEGVIKVSTDVSSAAGSYSLTVESRAERQKLASAAFAAGAESVVGEGVLVIKAGDQQFSVSIDAAGGTLTGIRDAINNASANPGVTASLVNTQAGTHLVITAAQTGVSNTVTLEGSGDLAQFSFDPADAGSSTMAVQVAASDASIVLDGFTLTSPVNTFSNVVEGLTIDVLKAKPGESIDLTVGKDGAGSKVLVESFVNAYNTLHSKLSELTAYNATSKSAGLLQSDGLARNLSSALRNEVNTAVAGVDTNFDTLSEFGIKSNAKTGKLEIDSTRLDKILSEGFENVSSLFGGDNGLAARMNESLGRYTKTDGLIQTRTDSLDVQAKDVARQREALELRMERMQARYTAQFTALDSLLAGMQSTSTFLTQQLASLQSL